VHGGERGRDAVRAEREEETLHAESEGRGNTGNTVSARPWEQRTSSLTKMSQECRTLPFTDTEGVYKRPCCAKGTHNTDSIIESKVIYYLEQCGLGV
jgi:hypothetical protein